jgi:hypothetical protein
MLVQVWARPVACPHSQQKACPQRHSTRLHLHHPGQRGGSGEENKEQVSRGKETGAAKLCACGEQREQSNTMFAHLAPCSKTKKRALVNHRHPPTHPPAVLLHRLAALGAGLGVGVEPAGGLAAILHAALPVTQHVAGGGAVLHLAAGEAELVAACAVHLRDPPKAGRQTGRRAGRWVSQAECTSGWAASVN